MMIKSKNYRLSIQKVVLLMSHFFIFLPILLCLTTIEEYANESLTVISFLQINTAIFPNRIVYLVNSLYI